MEPIKNYFGESNIQHVFKKALKRHLNKIPNNNSEETSPSKIGKKESSDFTLFLHDFPKESDIQKLSLYLTPIAVTNELENRIKENKYLREDEAGNLFLTKSNFMEEILKINTKFLQIENSLIEIKNNIQQNNENNLSLFALRQNLEDFISEVDEKEKKLSSTVSDFKKDQIQKIEDLKKLVDTTLQFKQEYVANVNSLNTSINQLRNEIRTVDNKALYASTFNNYKRTHENNFNTRVRNEEAKLKDELLKLIDSKINSLFNKKENYPSLPIEEKVILEN